jgi:hypothetical protein
MSENLTQQPQITQKSSAKFVVRVTLITTLVCVALVSMYMPRVITWYFEPPMPMGVSCTSSIRSAMDKLQMAQLYAILGGAILGLIIGFKFKKRA